MNGLTWARLISILLIGMGLFFIFKLKGTYVGDIFFAVGILGGILTNLVDYIVKEIYTLSSKNGIRSNPIGYTIYPEELDEHLSPSSDNKKRKVNQVLKMFGYECDMALPENEADIYMYGLFFEAIENTKYKYKENLHLSDIVELIPDFDLAIIHNSLNTGKGDTITKKGLENIRNYIREAVRTILPNCTKMES